MEGIVIRSTGSWYSVLGKDGTLFTCRLQGKHRLAGIKESNPVAVGDHVTLVGPPGDASITGIMPRRNHILRKSVKKEGHSSVLAANVDQVLVVATVSHPRTSLGFIDRVLVTAESFRIPQILLINKQDLLTAEEDTAVNEVIRLYHSVGVDAFKGSALTQQTTQDVLRRLMNKTTLVAGHSGVGKSTLLNQLSPDIRQTVSGVSDFTSKGTHTTTFAEMFRIAPDTFVIDTPGIKEWGLVDMEPQEISDYFPEMRELRNSCRFGSRCLHLNEPACAILDAVKNGQISVSRYESYLSMATGSDNRK